MKNLFFIFCLLFFNSLTAQNYEYIQEFDLAHSLNAFSEGAYDNWIAIKGSPDDLWNPQGDLNNPGGFAHMFSATGNNFPNCNFNESIAFQYDWRKGEQYQIEIKFIGSAPNSNLEIYLANGLSPVDQTLNCPFNNLSCDRPECHALNGPALDDAQELETISLNSSGYQTKCIMFVPDKDYEVIFFNPIVETSLININADVTLNFFIDYFKIKCGNQRYEDLIGNLEDENGQEKTTFCFGEDIYFDGTASINYDKYRYAWTERDNTGTPISYYSTEVFDGPMTGPFNVSEYIRNNPGTFGEFCPFGNYSFTLSLIKGNNCWTSVKFPFEVECCADTFDGAFEVLAYGSGNSIIIENHIHNNYGSGSSNCPIVNTWSLYESDAVDGDYNLVTSVNGNGYYFVGQKDRFYKVVRRLTTPCGEFCWAQRVYIGNGADPGPPIIETVDCPGEDECDPAEGLCFDGSGSGSLFSWDPVPGAVGYTVNLILNDPDCCPESVSVWEFNFNTTEPIFEWGNNISNICFSWNVSVHCSNNETLNGPKVCGLDSCLPECTDCDIEMPDFNIGVINSSCFAYTYFTPRSSDNCDLRYEIDWGDGNVGPINPWWASHVYAQGGTYRVCLNVIGTSSEGEECVESSCSQITLDCNPGKDGREVNDDSSTSRFSIEDNEIVASKFSVSPNPTNGRLNLVLNGMWDEQLSVRVLDVQGKVQQTKSFDKSTNSHLEIDINNLDAGTYFIRIIDSKGRTQIKRIVKI